MQDTVFQCGDKNTDLPYKAVVMISEFTLKQRSWNAQCECVLLYLRAEILMPESTLGFCIDNFSSVSGTHFTLSVSDPALITV